MTRSSFFVIALATGCASHSTSSATPDGPALVADGPTLVDGQGTGTWSAAGNLASGRTVLAGALLQSGKVLVMGGGTTTVGGVASAELYDPLTNSWSAAASMSTARAGHTASTLLSGKVLVTGGVNGDATTMNVLSSAELYDPATDQWSSAGSLSSKRFAHTATVLLSGKVLVVGSSFQNPTQSADLYDPVTNTWSSGGNLSVGRSQPTATLLLSGKVLVAGGDDTLTPMEPPVASAELYDPATNTWSAAGSMAHARFQYTATLLSSGKVLVAGGIGPSSINSAELYDPGTDTWSAAGNLADGRSTHTATLLPDGKVVVAAGTGPTALPGAFKSAELYDPTTNVWTATGALAYARGYHYATRLLSGEVLVAGGDDGGTTAAGVPTLAELYHQ